MRPLLLQSVAEAEVTEALEWYRGRSPAAAEGFLAAVDETIQRIRQRPEAFPQVTRTLRRALLPHFPYAVYYRILPEAVVVVGVVHGRRHPRRWRRRG